MHDLRIVHIGSFVLVYEIIETENTVLLLDYRHHDRVY
jgi:mRNA-degrading endonuclease RelE of RelBE toxin-antitoxin system